MAPSGSASSSSGFSSSDEDDAEHEQMQYERITTTASVSVTSVPVDVIEEEIENDTVAPSTAFTTSLDDDDDEAQLQEADLSALALHVDAQCMATATPLLQGSLSFHYEQFTAAIELVTASWPVTTEDDGDDDEAQDPKAMAYRALRAALYARFQRAFPLTPEMYAQWLSDLSERDLRAKQRVFELSARDYQSVALALQYAQFLHDNEGEAGLPTTESVMERLLRTVGTHYTLGHDVWKFYRELIQQDEQASPLQKEQRVRAFYARQMALPLQQNDLVMSEFRAWNNYNTLEPDAKRHEQLFANAVKRQTKGFGPLMKKMNQFEERLQAAASGQSLADEVPLDQIWLQYINFVTYRIVPLMQADEDNGAVTIGVDDLLKCMLERAVAMVCLSSTLWAKYAAFLGSASDASDAEKLALSQRAVRNVSFDSSVWNNLLLEMERQDASIAQLSAFFTRKIASRANPLMMDAYHFLSVLVTYCDVHRREAARKKINAQAMQQLEQAFQVCEQFCADNFPEFPLARTRIMEYHAKCSLLGSTSSSRQPATKFAKWNALWDEILQLRGQEAEIWVSYYQESLRTGAKSTAQEIRVSVFQRAMQQVTDYPVSILELWLVFERENGMLADFFHVRQLHADFAAKAAAAQVAETVAASVEAAAATPVQPESRKRKAVDAKSKPELKRAKPAPASCPKEDEPKSTSQQQQQAAKKAAVPEKLIEKKKTHEALTNAHTLFASNISKDVTKEELDALFQDIPGFKEVRLVVKARANHIKSRGMAYIQLSDEQGVAAGLLKNGLELKSQAMSIVQSKPPQASATTGDSGKDKNGDLSRDGTWKTDPVTIYVGGLVQKGENGGEHIGEAKLQEGIQQALQSAGELVIVKRVSILKDKRGKLKEYGLVEVAAPEQTAKCVEHLQEVQKILGDQITLKPSRFSIDQILLQQQNQMKKKETTDPSKTSGVSAGNAGGAVAPRAAARMNTMSLMPRALRRKQLAVSADASSVSALKASSNVTSSSTSGTAPAPASSPSQQTTHALTSTTTPGSDSRPKTNDDFRKLMMKQ